MKSRGSIFLALILALSGAARGAEAAQLQARLQPERVEAGETAMLELKIIDALSAELVELPAVQGLEARRAGSQTFSNIRITNEGGGPAKKVESGTMLLVQLIPEKPGVYVIPPVRVRAGTDLLASGELRLTVVDAGTGSAGARRGSLRLAAEAGSRRAFVGEPVVLRYFLMSRGLRIRRKPEVVKFPEAKGFVVREVQETVPDAEVDEGGERQAKVHAATLVVIPSEPGELTVSGGDLKVEVAREGWTSLGGRMQGLQFPPHTLSVERLPDAGRPDAFHGDVGVFTLVVEYEKDAIVAFDEKPVKVTVKGTGNLLTLSKPEGPEQDGVKVLFEEGKEKYRITGNRVEGERSFTFTLVPEQPGIVKHPGFSLAFFNPASGRFEAARTGPVSFEVKEGSSPRRRAAKDGAVEGLPLSLPLIGGIAFAVGALIALIITWERRRGGSLKTPGSPFPAAGSPLAVPSTPTLKNEREMLAAMRRDDPVAFLKAAQGLADDLVRLAGVTPPGEETRTALYGLRARIYACRYGAGTLGAGEMEDIHARLEALGSAVRGER